MARPSKCTAERKQRVLDALKAGNTRRAACIAAGIDQRTLERWQERYVGFAADLARAEAESEVALVGFIRNAAAQDWRAALTLLERRWPNDWGKRERIEVYHQVQQEAERLAYELGVPVDQVLREAGISLPTASN